MFLSTIRTIVLFVCSAGALGWATVRAESPPTNSEAAAPREPVIGADQRLREGSRMDRQQGHFKLTGDRLTFHVSQSDEKYLGLENLAMERIAKVISERHESPEQLAWEVTGVFTEYRGNNYLLITHAIIKNGSRTRRPAAAAP